MHGRIAAILTASLVQHVTANKLGAVYAAETGFKLASNPDHVRAPDVAFIRRERLEQTGEVEGYWPGAPDLAVEVVSPNDRYADIEDKVFDWLNAGTCMVGRCGQPAQARPNRLSLTGTGRYFACASRDPRLAGPEKTGAETATKRNLKARGQTGRRYHAWPDLDEKSQRLLVVQYPDAYFPHVALKVRTLISSSR